MRRRGLFVTIDGPSGVGKSTTVRLLADRLRSSGYPTHTTAEPSNGEIGRLARAHVDKTAGHALACLFAADRYQHLADSTRPRLAAGESVVQDRYLASSLVMQRFDGVELDYLSTLNAVADAPNLSVILTADPAIISRRLAKRGTHNRYQDAPCSTSRECHYFDDAADHLERVGVPVLRVDTTDTHPTVITEYLLTEIAEIAPVSATAEA